MNDLRPQQVGWKQLKKMKKKELLDEIKRLDEVVQITARRFNTLKNKAVLLERSERKRWLTESRPINLWIHQKLTTGLCWSPPTCYPLRWLTLSFCTGFFTGLSTRLKLSNTCTDISAKMLIWVTWGDRWNINTGITDSSWLRIAQQVKAGLTCHEENKHSFWMS